MEIKPIETIYNGYRFRSRLEARWAVFFDELGVQYEYEPEGFELPSGRRYLPDFKIKCYGTRGGNCLPDATYPCLHCVHNLDYETGFYLYGDGAIGHKVRNHCEVFEPVRDKNNPMFPNMDVNGMITVYDCNRKGYYEPFDLYVEVKGKMTRGDAERIKEFNARVLVVGDIPNPEEYEAQSDNLKSYERMDGVDIYPWNYETIDGDHFAAYPAVDSQGHFYLDGDDSNYQTMDINIIRNAFRAARQARFEHGETPRRKEKPKPAEPAPEKKPGRPKKKKEEPEQVIPLDRGKIKALYTAGWSMAKIADEMGCTYQRIDQILKEEGMKK